MSGWSAGLVFLYCARIIHGCMNIDNDSSRTVYAIVIMTLTNIACDLYVVFFTDWGIFGLALATSLSSLVYAGFNVGIHQILEVDCGNCHKSHTRPV